MHHNQSHINRVLRTKFQSQRNHCSFVRMCILSLEIAYSAIAFATLNVSIFHTNTCTHRHRTRSPTMKQRNELPKSSVQYQIRKKFVFDSRHWRRTIEHTSIAPASVCVSFVCEWVRLSVCCIRLATSGEKSLLHTTHILYTHLQAQCYLSVLYFWLISYI